MFWSLFYVCTSLFLGEKKSFCAWTYRISLKGPSDFQVVSFDTWLSLASVIKFSGVPAGLMDDLMCASLRDKHDMQQHLHTVQFVM